MPYKFDGPLSERSDSVLFLDKTFNSYSSSLHPGVLANCNGSVTNARGGGVGIGLRWTSIPSREE